MEHREHVVPVEDPPERGADAQRDVFVSRVQGQKNQGAPKGERLLKVLRVPAFWWMMIPASVAMGVTSALMSAMKWRSLWIVIPVWVLMVLGVICGIVWLRRRASVRGSAALTPAPTADESFRLQLVVDARPCGIDPLPSVMSEPAVFPVVFTLPRRSGWAIAAWVAVMLVFMGAGWWVKSRVLHMTTTLQPLDVWSMMALSAVPFAWLWPAYLRVSPGRLDVMRYGTLGIGRPEVRTVDLRRARVTCNLPGQFAMIREGQDEPGVIVPLPATAPAAAARAILEAARWEGEWADLPKDALVG